MRQYGVPVVVAINVFPGDAASEFEAIREVALAAGARDAVVTTHWADGGAGAEALAAAVWEAAEPSRPSSGCSIPTRCRCIEKIETIATQVYGADGVDLAPAAAKALAEYDRLGYGHLPVCMAKTHLSMSHDPSLLGRPTGFRVPIREVRLAAGAGFIYPLAGDMRTMPGLPSHAGRRERRHRRERQARGPVLGSAVGCPRSLGRRRAVVGRMVTAQERVGPRARAAQRVVGDDDRALEDGVLLSVRLEASVGLRPDA